jgi:23S rRNA (cytosine1962-C5)-methyltransferase
LRSISLSKNGINKIRAQQFELKSSDFEDSIKSFYPGEWCAMSFKSECWIGFINPLINEKYPCSHVVSPIKENEIQAFAVENFLEKKIFDAFKRRLIFFGYEKNSRVVYGESDGLPGLIVDNFENASIIQINTAGIDRYREIIKRVVEQATKKDAFFLDNQKYREKESLPDFGSPRLPDIYVNENQLKYKIRSDVIQKVGFYFDHRENRLQLMTILSRLNKKFKKGLDLFCYVGAWGMSALKSGISEMHFVDQGNFFDEIDESLAINEFSGRGIYHRSDVFNFLDNEMEKKSLYDLVICDPPAFAKSHLQRSHALEGYTKLHRKVLRIISSGGLVVFSSCTHYVSHEEFQKNITDAAKRESRKIQMIYNGIQGFDHPITSQIDRSNYIKSYFYIVE